MEGLFSREWVVHFSKRWNASIDMRGPLAAANFDAVIALGFIDEINPAVLLEVKSGKVIRAGLYDARYSSAINWDLRAAPGHWAEWKKEGLGISGLGLAVSSGHLQFKTGDYRKMIRQPGLAGPFLTFFTLI